MSIDVIEKDLSRIVKEYFVLLISKYKKDECLKKLWIEHNTMPECSESYLAELARHDMNKFISGINLLDEECDDPWVTVEWMSAGRKMVRRVKASRYYTNPAYYGYAQTFDDDGNKVEITLSAYRLKVIK